LLRNLTRTSSSIAILNRAADLNGVQNMNGSLQILNRNLANASQGSGPAVDALKQLNLTASQLSSLPADQRIALIGDRLREFVPVAQQAAVATDLFGRSGGEMLNLLRDSEIIGEATRQVEGFGLAISDVDAAKVEMANDALSSIQEVVKGIATQAAVTLAPILRTVALLFQEAAITGKGFGNEIQFALDIVTNAVGILADGIHGIKLAFKAVEIVGASVAAAYYSLAQGVSAAFDLVLQGITIGLNAAIRQFNKIPGVNISELVVGETEFHKKVRAAAEDARANVGNTVRELHDLAMQELPSHALKRYLKEAEDAATEAAKKVADSRSEMFGQGGADFIKDEDKAKEEKARKEKEDKEAERAAKELERAREQALAKLVILQESLMTEDELLAVRHEEKMEALREAFELELLTMEEYQELERELVAKHQQQLSDIEKKASDARIAQTQKERKERIDAFASMFSNLAALMNTGSRTMFEIGKVAAIATAVVKGYEAAVSSYAAGAKIGGPPVGAAFAAASLAATGAQISQIRASSFGKGATQNAAGFSGGVGAINTKGAAQQAPQQSARQDVNINLQGEVFTRGTVLSLINELNEAVSDGARLRIS